MTLNPLVIRMSHQSTKVFVLALKKCVSSVYSLLNVRICHHFACQSGASYGGKDMEITRSEIQTA